MEENIYVCPDCGEPLVKDYVREDGIQVWYCPMGDEEYYFDIDNGFLYAVCLWDGQRTCMGLANQEN